MPSKNCMYICVCACVCVRVFIKCVKSGNKHTKIVKLNLLMTIKRYVWINRRDLEIESDYKDCTQSFDRCDPKQQKHIYELKPNTKF